MIEFISDLLGILACVVMLEFAILFGSAIYDLIGDDEE